MQIYALDSQDALIHVSHAHRGQTYLCPECRGLVRLRGGSLRQLHFYHPESSLCQHHGKSPTHLHIQYTLQKMLTPETVLLEHRFPQISRIADVVWPAQKLIFEVQVSPISAEEVRARNQDYHRIGYQVVWILHDRQFNRSHLTGAEAELRTSPHYFTNINAFGKVFFYDQYSFIRFGYRIKRTNRFPVRFKRKIPINVKQLPRQFPPERKKWPLAFEGDLVSRPLIWQTPEKKTSSLFKRLYRILLHFLLEKTTY